MYNEIKFLLFVNALSRILHIHTFYEYSEILAKRLCVRNNQDSIRTAFDIMNCRKEDFV